MDKLPVIRISLERAATDFNMVIAKHHQEIEAYIEEQFPTVMEKFINEEMPKYVKAKVSEAAAEIIRQKIYSTNFRQQLDLAVAAQFQKFIYSEIEELAEYELNLQDEKVREKVRDSKFIRMIKAFLYE